MRDSRIFSSLVTCSEISREVGVKGGEGRVMELLFLECIKFKSQLQLHSPLSIFWARSFHDYSKSVSPNS